jgi:hypothetical protein
MSVNYDALASAILECTPAAYKSVSCKVEQVPLQCSGRLSYQISCPDYPDQSIEYPSDQLHNIAYEILRQENADSFTAKLVEQSVGWQVIVTFCRSQEASSAEKRSERDESVWQTNYFEREQFFQKHLGTPPETINKLMSVHWPGGGIFNYQTCSIPEVRVLASCGLSNPDMPSSAMIADFERVEKDGGVEFRSRLETRVPRYVPPGLAGFGYELLVFSGTPDDRYLSALVWLIEAEINRDANILGMVHEHGGVTIEGLNLGDPFGKSDFFIYPAMQFVPSSHELSSGALNVLVVTSITREEMNFKINHGSDELARLLHQSPYGQVSVPGRPSVAQLTQ